MTETTRPTVLMDGIAMGESPRWHDGRLWFADWGAQQLVGVDEAGVSEVIAQFDGMLPFCIDWLPDGRLVVVSAERRALLVRRPDGTFEPLADLGGLSQHPWNEVAVDGLGHAFVNCIGFDFGGEGGDEDAEGGEGGEGAPTGGTDQGPDELGGNSGGAGAAPGLIAVVTPDGAVRQVAGDLAFPNGMAITPDGRTLIVAESYGAGLTAFDIERDGSLTNRRIWADLGGDNPDGICLDADGTVWYASVPGQRCVRVREGGEVLDTVEADRGCFSCALGGADGRTLFIVAARWPDVMDPTGPPSGQVLTARAPTPAAPSPRP